MLGIVGALWSASGYVGAFTRAANVVWETPEGWPFWKLKPLQLLVTLVGILLVVLMALAVVPSGPIVEAVAQPLGLGPTAVTVWNVAKGPVMAVIVALMIAVLYYAWLQVGHRRCSIRRIVLDTIEVFGPSRCMIASNFPVDGLYSTFGALYAAFDTITVGLDPGERADLFADTARRFYRVPTAIPSDPDGGKPCPSSSPPSSTPPRVAPPS